MGILRAPQGSVRPEASGRAPVAAHVETVSRRLALGTIICVVIYVAEGGPDALVRACTTHL
jgi:hypothetical protein